MRRFPWLVLVMSASLLLAGCALDPRGGSEEDEAQGPNEGSETLRAGAWSMGEPVPTPRTEVASTIVEGLLAVIGGIEEGSVPTATVETLDLEEGGWEDAPDLPFPLHHARAVTVEGTVHVLGGYNAIPFQATPTHLTWVPGDDSWSMEDPLPNPRGAHGAAVVDGEIFLVGGVGVDGALIEAVDVYHPVEESWRSEADLPTPREHLGVAALAGDVYAIAGRMGGLDTNMDTLEALTPGEGWESLPGVPTPRGGLYAASVAGHVIAVGGEGVEDTFGEVEAYHPGAGSWTQLPGLQTPRHGLGVDAYGDTLVVTAGGPEPGLTVSDRVSMLPLEAVGSNA